MKKRLLALSTMLMGLFIAANAFATVQTVTYQGGKYALVRAATTTAATEVATPNCMVASNQKYIILPMSQLGQTGVLACATKDKLTGCFKPLYSRDLDKKLAKRLDVNGDGNFDAGDYVVYWFAKPFAAGSVTDTESALAAIKADLRTATVTKR